MARIAVIGAGMGAMAAAARLAVAGHRVTVYERTATYGGSVGRFERDGFAFDTGPGLLHLPAVYRDLFVKTGKEPLESCVELVQVDPAARHVFADGTEVSLPNASRAGVVSALGEALGADAGERWGDFLVRAREAWDRTRRPLLEEPLWPNWRVLAEREPYPALSRRRLLRTRTARTLAEVGTLELGDPRLTALLESHALAAGLDPRTAPASAAVLPYMEHAFGAWYVRGGVRELARAVYERCTARRVEFVFGAEVVSVVEKDGRASGVELADGTVAGADFVVGGPPDATAALTGGQDLYGGDAPEPDPAALSCGKVVVCLALRGPRETGAAHRTVVHTTDREDELALFGTGGPPARPTVWVERPDDPLLRPDGHESVVLTATVPSLAHHDWSAAGAADAFADRMVAAAGRALPSLPGRVLWREVRTPVHTERETGAEGGAVPAPTLAGGDGVLLRPSNSTRVPGLFTAGGWAHPGGGLPHAGMSGALVAGLIVEGPDFRGSQ
ncbi:phytoene desaturase family protein [Streptomyces fructofermentans]|uniref:phytoene desaturase family protein n=1 Tax=Streptomyces fructofermentans TaxID=152141 RepID=UPI0037B6D2BB